jgi:DNA-binding CsgD family transcriptional regulator
MAKSRRLRLTDVRDAFRLLGDCRDLGRDPLAWRRHALAGLCRLAGAESGNGAELRWPRREEPFTMVLPFETGFTPDQLALYDQFMREFGPEDPMVTGALRRMRSRVSTRPRTALIEERVWRGSHFVELYDEARLRYDLFSIAEGPGGTLDAVILHRDRGGRDFEERSRRLVQLFQAEASRLFGRALASADGSALATLSPRLRETLRLLLAGEGEKQVAARMGLRRSTVHEYITEIYRRLQVSSRGELMALFVNHQ